MSEGKSGVSSSFLPGEIRCQFFILGKSGVSSSFLPEKMNRHRGKSGVSSSFLPEKMNRQRITREKMNRHRITPRHRITLGVTRRAEWTMQQGNPVSQQGNPGKSGVSSPFLAAGYEKMNRHRITREKMNRHRITPVVRPPPAPDAEPWINRELVGGISSRLARWKRQGLPSSRRYPCDHSPYSSDPGVTRQAEWTMQQGNPVSKGNPVSVLHSCPKR